MDKSKRLSIRVRLFNIVAVFGILLSFVFMLVALVDKIHTTSKTVQQTLILEGSRTSLKVRDYFTTNRQILNMLSMEKGFHKDIMDEDSIATLTKYLGDVQNAFDIRLCFFGREEDGSILNYEPTEAFDSRKRPWYIEAKEQGSLIVTAPYIGAGTNELITTMALPCYSEEGLTGVLGIDFSLDAIERTLNPDTRIFSSQLNMLVKEDGQVLLTNGKTPSEQTFPIGQKVTSRLGLTTFDDKSYLARIYYDVPTKLYIVSCIGPEEIWKPALEYLIIYIVIASAFLICMIAVMNHIIGNLIIKPINILTMDMKNIQSFHLDEIIEVDDRSIEIYQMATGLENMKRGLRSFRKYAPGDLVYKLITDNTEAKLSAEKRTLSVCFCDIADFTSISESLPPLELTELLGVYFETMTRILQEHEATVDKFIGDSIMAFWNAPREVPEHARLACHAILRCAEFVEEFNASHEVPFHTRFGLSYGEAIVGNMGYEDRLGYTALGDTVNVASRFEGINKFYGTTAVVTEGVWEQTNEEFAYRLIDKVVVKGRKHGINVYELMGRLDEFTSQQLAALDQWQQVMEHYYNKEWKLCLRALGLYERNHCINLFGSRKKDKVYPIIYKRLKDFIKNPPPDSWTGAVVLKSK
ncbi:adenylate/guanylate cyclase domain-containing protein [Spirochaeta cellobiosiphila]|uniref:adenylate/guanylate cyclase domain-containing protein n=1 Tax=Spirochaeta cellobiosiphila TaxID=504483 RepID=UPI00048CEB0C|nr:adenylate/guanylate cyclase domain-containing protein [Spirochaeta cellobiosiphila]